MHLQPVKGRGDSQPCEIFFHIPKTGGQSLHNLISREYRNRSILNTHCGLLTPQVWQNFTRPLESRPVQLRPRYEVVIGHMKLGVHELLRGPSRYITFLRDPVKRFLSYYFMLQRMEVVPRNHRIDPDRPDWNLSQHESLPCELDNGQTRALANADWDLPLGQCTGEHLKMAKANLDHYFEFVGLTEHFDLSLMLLKRICGWRWHLYARKNVSPIVRSHNLDPGVLDAIARMNCFDRELYDYAKDRLMATASRYGMALRLERAAFVACNGIHRGKHHIVQSVKKKLRRAVQPQPKPVQPLLAIQSSIIETL
jgi:hypothetical protein